MPTILIDATHFGSVEATGVENYVQHLLPVVSTLLLEKDWVVSWIGHSEMPPSGMPETVSWVHAPHAPFWSQRGLARYLNKEKPDLFFTPSGIPPIGYRGRVAITVHDMAAYIAPEAFSQGQRFRLRTLLGKAAKSADIILTPSQYSKEQIIKFWQTDEKKITVTPESCDLIEVKPEPVEGVSLDAPLFFFIGRIETKKNVLRIVEAFAALSHETAQLVLAGKQGLGGERIMNAIAELPEAVKSRIMCPGYVSNGQREWLFQKATAFLIPGALEGYSLPLLEAFGHGVPAICAEAGPLPEIGSDACLYADPESSPEWTTAMKKVLEDSQVVEVLKAKGGERLKAFSWENTAQLSVDAFLAIA